MKRIAPDWLAGCTLRPIWFQPTFHKHVGQLCAGLFIHAEGAAYDHARRSARGVCRRQRSGRCGLLAPDYPLWRDFPYEYEFDKLAIDVINGGTGLREWVDDPAVRWRGTSTRWPGPTRRRGSRSGGAVLLY